MLNLLDIIHRQSVPKPWVEGEKIPWDDPDFSKRMLNEHLSQQHDAASRRFEIIEKHVNWIHNQILKGNPTRIIDLGCGPGFYTQRLAQLGHLCTGIDFSPASIEYARKQAEEVGNDCEYIQKDIRAAEFGGKYGLVMSIYGEINVFQPEEAKRILAKANRALLPNGYLLIEPHTYEIVVEVGEKSPSWYSTRKGLFSDKPHLFMQENFWDAANNVAIQRYYIIDAKSGKVMRHSSSTQAYKNEEYHSLLTECGFEKLVFFPALGGDTCSPDGGFIAILAQKGVA